MVIYELVVQNADDPTDMQYVHKISAKLDYLSKFLRDMYKIKVTPEDLCEKQGRFKDKHSRTEKVWILTAYGYDPEKQDGLEIIDMDEAIAIEEEMEGE